MASGQRLSRFFKAVGSGARRIAQRIVSPDESERETRALPFSESLEFHRRLAPPVTKGSGVGFVTNPYQQYIAKIWGVQLFEDYAELRRMYKQVPYINAAVNVTANLTLSSGFSLVGGDEKVREYLRDTLDELNIDQVLRPAVIDMLVFGNAFIEKCYEKMPDNGMDYVRKVQEKYSPFMLGQLTGQYPDFVGDEEVPEAKRFVSFDEKNLGNITQLKVLDPTTVRLRADAYGNIFGAVQLIVVPPVVFRSWQLIQLKYIARSEFNYGIYGFSPLNALIGIQRKIEAFEDAMAQIVIAYGKPMLIVKVGTPDRPATDAEVKAVRDAFAERQPASDIIVKGNYEVQPIQALSPSSAQVNWYLDYLLQQRDALLGVPKIFLGKSEGANRATSEVVLAEYLARITALQANIAQQLEDNLFKPLVRVEFGEGVEIPRIKWNEILPPTKTQNILNALNMFKAGLITLKEARDMIGLETTDEVLEELKAKAQPKPVGAMPQIERRPPELRENLIAGGGR